MTMMQKIQAKKSKKGFTLVELVIVIAILAILAAIAIPVITTTINSSKVSTLKSDGATVGMLVKEAINNNLAHIDTTTYGGTKATDPNLTVLQVLKANDIDPSAYSKGSSSTDTFYERTIGGKKYGMYYNIDGNKVFSLQTGIKGTDSNIPSGATLLADTTKINELANSINGAAAGT